MGEKVRFDGSHRSQRWVRDELTQFFDFQCHCPEVAVGMSIPRRAVRLVERDGERRMLTSKGSEIDWTDQVATYADGQLERLAHLRGFLLTSNSPSCGMERVRVYQDDDSGRHVKNGVGLFAASLKAHFPWMPLEEDGRLNDPMLRENFMLRVFALDDLHNSLCEEFSVGALVAFHSRYKLMLMAHSQADYRSLGRLVAEAKSWNLDELFGHYRLAFMKALAHRVKRQQHVNVLMHVMGYFKRYLSRDEKAELNALIMQYHAGEIPLLAPLTLLNHYLKRHPNDYLAQQTYLNPYPSSLRLRYGV